MINEKDVQYIASLARIHLDEAESKALTTDLEKILGYVSKLESLDLKDAAPTSHAIAIKNVFRDDEVRPSLDQKTALANAPEQLQGSFKVPQVIE